MSFVILTLLIISPQGAGGRDYRRAFDAAVDELQVPARQDENGAETEASGVGGGGGAASGDSGGLTGQLNVVQLLSRDGDSEAICLQVLPVARAQESSVPTVGLALAAMGVVVALVARRS